MHGRVQLVHRGKVIFSVHEKSPTILHTRARSLYPAGRTPPQDAARQVNNSKLLLSIMNRHDLFVTPVYFHMQVSCIVASVSKRSDPPITLEGLRQTQLEKVPTTLHYNGTHTPVNSAHFRGCDAGSAEKRLDLDEAVVSCCSGF